MHFKPSSKSDISMQHPMGSKTVCGFSVGYHQHEGGKWSGDVYVRVVKSLEGDTKPRCRRIPASEIYVPKKKGREDDLDEGFRFPAKGIEQTYGE